MNGRDAELAKGGDVELVEAEVVEPPEAALRGRFSIYAPEGKPLVFALRIEGDTEDRHFVVPPMMVRLLSRQLGADVGEALRRLRGGEELTG